jgi:hypothetical protein
VAILDFVGNVKLVLQYLYISLERVDCEPLEFCTEKGNVDQEIDGKMKCGRMEELWMEKGGGKKYITERNGRSS